MNLSITPVFALCCLLMSGASAVYSAEPFKDFTFKRIKPPAPGVTKRIIIQIKDPVDQIAVVPNAVQPILAGMQDWFWDQISPNLANAGPGRFAAAITVLQKAVPGTITTPRFQDIRQLAQDHGTRILIATVGKKISPAFVLAVIAVENAAAPQRADILGLMPIPLAVVARFAPTDPLDPAQSIRGGVAYLDWLLSRFDRDPILALATYHAGEEVVKASGGVPVDAEIRTFVPQVLAAWQVTRALCVTPPELYSDGCVFSVKDAN